MRVKVRSLRAELGKILSTVVVAPVTVARHGEDIAVIISPADFAEFNRLRREYTTISSRVKERVALHS